MHLTENTSDLTTVISTISFERDRIGLSLSKVTTSPPPLPPPACICSLRCQPNGLHTIQAALQADLRHTATAPTPPAYFRPRHGQCMTTPLSIFYTYICPVYGQYNFTVSRTVIAVEQPHLLMKHSWLFHTRSSFCRNWRHAVCNNNAVAETTRSIQWSATYYDVDVG